MGGCDIPAVGGPPLRHDGTVGTDGRWAGRRASHGPGGRAGPGARGGPASSTRRAPWCLGPTCWPWLSHRGRVRAGATGSPGPPRRCPGYAPRLCWLDLSDVACEGIRRGRERDPERPRRSQGSEYDRNRGFVWVAASAKTPAYRRRCSRRARFPNEGRGGHRWGVVDTPWRLRCSCHPTQLVGATVYTNAPKRLREAVLADLCTLLRPHGPSRDRVGHGSHDVDGPLAPVTPGCLDLRPTPPGR